MRYVLAISFIILGVIGFVWRNSKQPVEFVSFSNRPDAYYRELAEGCDYIYRHYQKAGDYAGDGADLPLIVRNLHAQRIEIYRNMTVADTNQNSINIVTKHQRIGGFDISWYGDDYGIWRLAVGGQVFFSTNKGIMKGETRK